MKKELTQPDIENFIKRISATTENALKNIDDDNKSKKDEIANKSSEVMEVLYSYSRKVGLDK